MTASRYVVLVQAHEYDPRKGIPFGEKCANRVTERVRYLEEHKNDASLPYGLTLPADIVFLRYDIKQGIVERRVHSLTNKSKPFKMTKRGWKEKMNLSTPGEVYSIADTLRSIAQTEYKDQPFDDHPGLVIDAKARPRPMSITDVYQSVRQAPAGSVIELSIFSHAWASGPILANTNDTQNDLRRHIITTRRDEGDLDCRYYVDFNENMGEEPPAKPSPGELTRLAKFKNGFAAAAEIHIWGCDGVSEEDFKRFRGIYKQLEAKKKKQEEPKDDTILKYKAKIEVKDDTGKVVKDPKTGHPKTKTVIEEITFRAHQKWVALMVMPTYPFRCAAVTGVTTYGMLPVCTSENSGTDLMIIDPGHTMDLLFYKKYMGMRADDYGFGVFDADAVKHIKDLATWPPPASP